MFYAIIGYVAAAILTAISYFKKDIKSKNWKIAIVVLIVLSTAAAIIESYNSNETEGKKISLLSSIDSKIGDTFDSSSFADVEITVNVYYVTDSNYRFNYSISNKSKKYDIIDFRLGYSIRSTPPLGKMPSGIFVIEQDLPMSNDIIHDAKIDYAVPPVITYTAKGSTVIYFLFEYRNLLKASQYCLFQFVLDQEAVKEKTYYPSSIKCEKGFAPVSAFELLKANFSAHSK